MRGLFSGATHYRIGLTILVALFLVAGFLRLNDFSLYTPDSVRYVIWGNSLAHGRGFVDDTQPEAQRFVEHAPLYALLLAPAGLLAPLSLTAAKLTSLGWGALVLVLAGAWFRRRLGETAALAGLLLLAASPLLFVYATEALSEAPFVAFVLAILLLAERVGGPGASSKGEWYLLLGLVATVGLLREVGAAVALAVVIFVASRRLFLRAALLALASAALLAAWYVRNQVLVPLPEGSMDANTGMIFQHFVTGADASMAAEFSKRIWIDLQAYAWQLGGMLFYPAHGSGQLGLTLSAREFPSAVRLVVVSVTMTLLIAGIAADWKDRAGATFRLLLAGAYLLGVLVYPVHDIRFLFPLLPLMILYVLAGAERLPEYLPAVARYARPAYVLPAVFVLMLPNILVSAEILSANASYRSSPMGFYAELIKRQSYPTVYTHPWTLVGEFVRDSVPADAVIATPDKQLALVSGGRKVLELSPELTVPIFERDLRDNGVSYLVSENRWEDHKDYEFLMAESPRYRFDSVFAAANLLVYRVSSRLRTGDATGQGRGFASLRTDSVSAAGLLRLGRAAFLRGEETAAAQIFQLSAARAPGQPEPLYQAIAASSLMGDEPAAERLYERLITLPQSASFTYLARTHIEAMRVALSARGVPPTQERAVKMNDLARLYWDMGYRSRAERLSDASLALDSTYFWGLLWGFHFNEQNGDTAGAATCYRQLLRIDAKNQVVASFTRLLAIRDSLRRSPDARTRAMLHVDAGRLYLLIELFEVALDEAERALGAEPGNAEATALMAETFYAKGRKAYDDAVKPRPNASLRAAARWYDAVLSRDRSDARALAMSDTLRTLLLLAR